MITGDAQATATAIATMLGRGCQLDINEPHFFFQSILNFVNWTCQLVKMNSVDFIFHIFTTWHPKFVELGKFCDTKSYNWHPLILGIQTQAGEKMVLSGAEVDTMSDVELQNVADKVINFFSLRIKLFSEIHSWLWKDFIPANILAHSFETKWPANM